MRQLGYGIVYGFFYMVSLLPYKALYVLSDFLYIIVYHVVRYRRKLVRQNISSSFPEKSVDEYVSIEKGFYRWFCDYFVETVKLMSVTSEELLRHIEFRNSEEIERCFDDGQACAALLGHYCNWELLSATGLSFKKHHEAVCGLIYHPMHSAFFDKLFIKIRQSMGGLCIPKKDVPRYLISFRSQNLMSLFGYISDQLPKYTNIHLWLPFLNHDTPVFTGGERLMRKMNNAVFYVDMERPERGKYICTFKLMTRTPNELPEFELTRRFFVMLEETIRRDARYYLWSHNRWRRTHEEFDRMYKVENGHVVKRQENEE